MKNINPDQPIWKLTVEEFLEVAKQLHKEDPYVRGLAGLAKLLGCSVSKVSALKSTGIIDEAIIQHGNIILIDKKLVLELLAKKKK